MFAFIFVNMIDPTVIENMIFADGTKLLSEEYIGATVHAIISSKQYPVE